MLGIGIHLLNWGSVFLEDWKFLFFLYNNNNNNKKKKKEKEKKKKGMMEGENLYCKIKNDSHFICCK